MNDIPLRISNQESSDKRHYVMQIPKQPTSIGQIQTVRSQIIYYHEPLSMNIHMFEFLNIPPNKNPIVDLYSHKREITRTNYDIPPTYNHASGQIKLNTSTEVTSECYRCRVKDHELVRYVGRRNERMLVRKYCRLFLQTQNYINLRNGIVDVLILGVDKYRRLIIDIYINEKDLWMFEMKPSPSKINGVYLSVLISMSLS